MTARRSTSALGLLVAVGAALVAAPAARASVALHSDGVATLTGVARGERAGTSVAVVDGRPPRILAGAPGADPARRANAGVAYLAAVDRPGLRRLDRAAVLTLRGGAAGDRLGESVAAPGDVNGDGIGDLLVGAPGADAGGRRDAGAAYVVFGGATGSVDAGDLGTGGFRVDGPTASGLGGAAGGAAVAAAGDVNRDGLADVLVSAPAAAAGRPYAIGKVYVVFGKRDGAPVDLDALGSRGVAIAPSGGGRALLGGLAGGVDVNGDGTPDQALGFDEDGDEGAGHAAVVLGSRPAADAAVGQETFFGGGGAGASRTLALTADTTGDGRGELVAGSPEAGCPSSCFPNLDDANRRERSGSVNVVWGRAGAPGTVMSGRPRRDGFRIDGARAGAGAGAAVTAPGDLNGDAVPDVGLGAPSPGPLPGVARAGGRTPGSAFVVYGGRSRRTVDLARLGSRGFSYRGARTGDHAGGAVAGGADLDRDGRPDLGVGASLARGSRGTVTVVPPPATTISDRPAQLVRGRVPVRVRCLAPRGHRCRGVLTVRTAKRVGCCRGRPRVVLIAREPIDLRARRTTRLLLDGTREARRLIGARRTLRLLARVRVHVSSSLADRPGHRDSPAPRPTTTTTAWFTLRTAGTGR